MKHKLTNVAQYLTLIATIISIVFAVIIIALLLTFKILGNNFGDVNSENILNLVFAPLFFKLNWFTLLIPIFVFVLSYFLISLSKELKSLINTSAENFKTKTGLFLGFFSTNILLCLIATAFLVLTLIKTPITYNFVVVLILTVIIILTLSAVILLSINIKNNNLVVKTNTLKTLNETILQQKEDLISNTAEPNNQANNNFNNENKN